MRVHVTLVLLLAVGLALACSGGDEATPASSGAEIFVDYAGEGLSIAFNARYLLDALSAMGTKEVTLGFQDDLSPARLVPSNDEDTLAVVMPMRV